MEIKIIRCRQYYIAKEIAKIHNIKLNDCIIITNFTGIEKIKEKLQGIRGKVLIFTELHVRHENIDNYVHLIKEIF